MELTNTFFFYRILEIGGIETFLYNIAKKYADRDITIFYMEGAESQLERLEKLVRVEKYTNQKIKCKRAFFNFNIEPIDNFEADEYIQILHGDYKALHIQYQIHPKMTKYIAVSKIVADAFHEATGLTAEVCYNPIANIEQPKKVLHLVSATRLSTEKGGERMQKLAEALKKANIPFVWDVYTNIHHSEFGDYFSFKNPTLDILTYIADADYLVQLSDSEGYGYSVQEALAVGTPVIVTDLPIFKELGVNTKNAFMLPLDMSEIPVDKIYEGIPEFTFKPKADKWGKLLGNEKSTYKNDVNAIIEVRATQDYYDTIFNRLVKKGEEYEATYLRAKKLFKYNVAERR